MVDAGHEGGVLEGDERQMIYSIFELGEHLVREIMLPASTSMPWSLHALRGVDTLIRLVIRACRVRGVGDNILGLLYAKDLLRSRTRHSW